MKPTFSKFFVLVLLITFISISITRPVSAQAPEPPEILENGEFATKLDQVEYAIAERNESSMIAGDNGINAVSTYWSASGTTFVPASNSINWLYGSGGCIDTGATNDVWRGSVNLPHHSTITGMYFNYDNEIADPIDTTIYLRRYSFTGAYNDILFVNGSYTGTGNHTHYTATVANNYVNNYDYAYVLVWIGRTDQNLCGVNLIYSPPPLFLQALPIITR